MFHALPHPALDAILAGVSRSFYLSLVIAPRSLRTPFAIAYLLARAADTIADTRIIAVSERRALLQLLREALVFPNTVSETVRRKIAGSPQIPAEEQLLLRLEDCLVLFRELPAADRTRIAQVLAALLHGMERDLERFPAEEATPVALTSMEELDEHCYLAAGCVGEFWTEMAAAHLPELGHMRAPDLVVRGVRLGKALQLINVIRDAPADLTLGRCYFPQPLLDRLGLQPSDLLSPVQRLKARPIILELVRLALEHVDAAWPYVMAIPPRLARLRLASLWPLWIGLDTLGLIAAHADPLDPADHVKVPRFQVYRMLVESSALVLTDPLFLTALRRAHQARRSAVQTLLR